MKKKKSMKVLLVCLVIIIVKAIWVGIAIRHNGDFESERQTFLHGGII